VNLSLSRLDIPDSSIIISTVVLEKKQIAYAINDRLQLIAYSLANNSLKQQIITRKIPLSTDSQNVNA
jgi:hypothetical protein